MTDPRSQWYPYIRVQDSYFDLSGSVNIPKKICDYLLDAPAQGYVPPDDNRYARCRFWKYLYHDGPEPLRQPLPGIAQKMSVLFEPTAPENPPTDKGYRLIPQIWTKPSQTDAQTRVYVYLGRTVPSQDDMKIAVSVCFYIWTHYTYELNTRTDAYSRAFAIEQALIEAFHGVNMDGVGTFFLSRNRHSDCGSRAIYDGDINVGRELTMALEIASVQPMTVTGFSNMPYLRPDGSIRLA